MKFKSGVVIYDMHPEMERVITEDRHVLDSIFHRWVGRQCVITSAREGTHMENSLHWEGRAIDVRTRDMAPDIAKECALDLQDALGHDFDVVWEPNHIHIEYDPQ